MHLYRKGRMARLSISSSHADRRLESTCALLCRSAQMCCNAAYHVECVDVSECSMRCTPSTRSQSQHDFTNVKMSESFPCSPCGYLRLLLWHRSNVSKRARLIIMCCCTLVLASLELLLSNDLNHNSKSVFGDDVYDKLAMSIVIGDSPG